MSLINDALRKARFEAARQDSSRRGVPLPAIDHPRSSVASSKVGWAVAAVAILLLVGAALYFVGRRSGLQEAAPQSAANVETTETGAPAPAGPAATAGAELEAPTPPAGSAFLEPAPESPPVAERNVPTPAAPPTQEPTRHISPAPTPQGARIRIENPAPVGVLRPVSESPTATAPQPSITSAPPPAPTRRESTSLAEEAATPVYVSSARLGGNVTLELGGIAWSANRPFALINGNVVGPGDRVDGFTVLEIQPRHVELAGQDEALILQLK